jgi:hypothetical protein
MFDSNADEQNAIDARRIGIFGIDKTGAAHRYDAVTDTLVVTRDEEVVHETELGDRSMDEWIDFIDQKRGWIDQWFHERLDPVTGAERMAAARSEVAA